MTREEMLEKYQETTQLLVYRGPYEASDYFAFAIARKAMNEVFGRNPGFFTAKDIEKDVEGLVVRPGCKSLKDSYIKLPYKHGRVVGEEEDEIFPACHAWKMFRDIIEPDEKVADMVEVILEFQIDSSSDEDDGGIQQLFAMYNPNWYEMNEAMTDAGHRYMFFLQKKLLNKGIIMASEFLDRIIASCKNKVELGREIKLAYENSAQDEDLILDKNDDSRYSRIILAFDKSYHIYDATKVVYRHVNIPTNVRILLQSNVKNGELVGYCAKTIDHKEAVPFRFDKYWDASWKRVRLLSEHGNVVGVNDKDDYDELILFCHYAYEAWKKELSEFKDMSDAIFNPTRIKVGMNLSVVGGHWMPQFKSSHDEDPSDEEEVWVEQDLPETETVHIETDEEATPEVEEAHEAGELFDPMKDFIRKMRRKVKECLEQL